MALLFMRERERERRGEGERYIIFFNPCNLMSHTCNTPVPDGVLALHIFMHFALPFTSLHSPPTCGHPFPFRSSSSSSSSTATITSPTLPYICVYTYIDRNIWTIDLHSIPSLQEKENRSFRRYLSLLIWLSKSNSSV